VPSGTGAKTVASLARGWMERDPKSVALREKDFGIWREYSWADTWELIELAAHGLLALGVEVGDRVTIQSEDRPEWVILDIATVAVRGVTVGLYPTNPAAEVEYMLTDSGSVVHLAEDQEQVDKVFEIDPAASANVRSLIYVEPRASCSGRTSLRADANTAMPTPGRLRPGWPMPRTTTS